MTAEANNFLKKIFRSLQKLRLILFMFPGLLMCVEPKMPSFIDMVLEEKVGGELRRFYKTQRPRNCHLSCSVDHEGHAALWDALLQINMHSMTLDTMGNTTNEQSL